jgi:type II secretory pathway component GspD/PulD (secretin)
MPKTNSSNETGFKKFLKQNKSLTVLLPLLAVLLVVVIIVNLGGGSDKPASQGAPSPTPAQGALDAQTGDKPKVEILPKTERVNDPSAGSAEEQAAEPRQDPFKSPMKLTGTFRYSNGTTSAIIEYGGVSYIVRKGEAVGDSLWKVSAITDSRALLESVEQDVTLELDLDHSFPPYDIIPKTDGTVVVSIRTAGADMRDIISAIALEMKCSIIFTGEAIRMDLDYREFTLEDALGTLLRTNGMDYFRKGSSLIVGTKEKLTEDFFDSMAITKFTLKYITSDMISDQIDALGLSVQKMTLEENPYAVWVQGFPQELAKVGEIVDLLDRPENKPVPTSSVSVFKLTPIELSYITAEQMNTALAGIGLEPGIILDSNPKTLYVYATKEELSLISELKSKLDIAANQKGSGAMTISLKKLQYVSVDEILPIIAQFGIDVDVITLDRISMTLWLFGEEGAIKQVTSMIDKIDLQQNLDDGRFFIRKMKNITAMEAETRLRRLNIPGIETYTFDYPAFAKSILVVCPKDYQLYVKNYLSELDVETDVIKVPVDYSNESPSYLAARRDLLVTLTGIPASSFTISGNVSRTQDPYYVLILEATQEKVRLVQDMIEKIDSP